MEVQVSLALVLSYKLSKPFSKAAVLIIHQFASHSFGWTCCAGQAVAVSDVVSFRISLEWAWWFVTPFCHLDDLGENLSQGLKIIDALGTHNLNFLRVMSYDPLCLRAYNLHVSYVSCFWGTKVGQWGNLDFCSKSIWICLPNWEVVCTRWTIGM